MTASAILSSLLNDAYRNGKDETHRALSLMRDPVAELEAELEQKTKEVFALAALHEGRGEP